MYSKFKNASQSSLKLLVCSSVPDNLSIGNSMELCMKVLLNCIRLPPVVCISPHRQVDGSQVRNVRETFIRFYTLFNDKLRGFLHSAMRKKIVSVYRKRKSRARIPISPKFYRNFKYRRYITLLFVMRKYFGFGKFPMIGESDRGKNSLSFEQNRVATITRRRETFNVPTTRTEI